MAQQRITTDRLLAYAAGDLSPEEALVVEAHLARDPEAARTVAYYRLSAHHTATDDSVTPPPAPINRAKGIARTLATTGRPAVDWLTRVQAFVADVIFDSRVQPAAVRDEVAGTRVQLGFAANGVEIELQADRDTSLGALPWRVLGQIDAEEESETTGAEVVITVSGTTDVVDTTTADDRGMFSVSLTDGRYDVHVRLAGNAIVLRDVDLN
jgi:hypothetical protein